MNHFLPYADRPAPKPRKVWSRSAIIAVSIGWGLSWTVACATIMQMADYTWQAASGFRLLASKNGDLTPPARIRD